VQRWRGLASVPPGWGRCVVTIGVFDGLHRGHRAIIGRALERGRTGGLPTVLMTFDPHPSEVVRPGSHPAVLTPPRLKAELLEALGVDVMCVLPFTIEFSRLEPAEFVYQALVERLHAAAVVVGENFRFGHKAAGDVALLRELGKKFGFATEGVPLLPDGPLGSSDTPLSSTYVRSCVDAGDVAGAARALEREHRVEGVVIRGDRRGHELGYPTANVDPVAHSAIPSDGVYAGHLLVRGQRYPAAVSIGTNPTFEGRERRVEAYVLDVDDATFDIYGERVGVEFTDRLRDTVRFTGPADLVAQMGADVAEVRRRLR
jgi:riboflavin kinase/FMN adenylyltransferase